MNRIDNSKTSQSPSDRIDTEFRSEGFSVLSSLEFPLLSVIRPSNATGDSARTGKDVKEFVHIPTTLAPSTNNGSMIFLFFYCMQDDKQAINWFFLRTSTYIYGYLNRSVRPRKNIQ